MSGKFCRSAPLTCSALHYSRFSTRHVEKCQLLNFAVVDNESESNIWKMSLILRVIGASTCISLFVVCSHETLVYRIFGYNEVGLCLIRAEKICGCR